jgi:phosphoadenosine phosphosulfate reductase
MQTVFTKSGLTSLKDIAIARIQTFEPEEGYYLAHSGGKDSVVCDHLLRMAGVKYDAHHNLTTLDPPQLVRFIKNDCPHVHIHPPAMTMWQLMKLKKFPPTRQVRYCCEVLKEGGGEGRTVVTGVRWAESKGRSELPHLVFDAYGSQSKKAISDRLIFQSLDDDTEKRRMIESCITQKKHILNPIIEWSDADVWNFIHAEGIKYCSLYDEGFDRIGCVACPLVSSKKRKSELERFPHYKRGYIRAFNFMINEGHVNGIYMQYVDGESAFNDWVERGRISKVGALE